MAHYGTKMWGWRNLTISLLQRTCDCGHLWLTYYIVRYTKP